MRREVVLGTEPIEEDGRAASRPASREAGAVVSFRGVVRAGEGERTIEAIDYEAHEPMAVHQFHLLLDEVERQWSIESVRIVHRFGRVAVGETSLWLEVVAGHRREAFAAAEWLIDRMKRRVPIWKRPV